MNFSLRFFKTLTVLMLSGVFAFTSCFDDRKDDPKEEVYSYNVTFDSQSADTQANPALKTVNSPATTLDALPDPPLKTGLNFAGWWTEPNGGGSVFTADTPVVGHITVYANWIPAAVVGPIIIDHSSVEKFDHIPDRYIAAIKSMTIQYVGQSHGRQIPRGLALLSSDPQYQSKYKVQISTDLEQLNDPSALKILRSQMNQYFKWGNDTTDESLYWSTQNGKNNTIRTAQYCIQQNQTLTISLWCWCWDIINPATFFSQANDFTEVHLDWYTTAINEFNSNSAISSTKFIYHTSITDTSVGERGWRVTRMNDLIRQAAQNNGGILFDQADIENWNEDNSEQRVDTWDGNTLYLRHASYNDNGTNTPPSFKDGHTTDANCVRKAKALWVLLACLAGWDGVSQ